MIQIRKANKQDLPALAELFDAYRVFYKKEPDLDGATRFLLERMEQQQSIIFIATYQNIICGFVQLYPLFSSTRMKPLLLLNDLFVTEKYRGMKISIALVEQAKSACAAQGACGLLLETAKDNSVANKLYIQQGFEPDREHNYYSWDLV